MRFCSRPVQSTMDRTGDDASGDGIEEGTLDSTRVRKINSSKVETHVQNFTNHFPPP